MQLIDGKLISEAMISEIKQRVDTIVASGRRAPHLAAIIVGNDGASETYVGHKEKACAKVGFSSTIVRFPENIQASVLLDRIAEINANPDIDGLIVQLPLPSHIDEQPVIEAIDPGKDVDGFHPVNLGKLLAGIPAFVSATPFGIIELLRRYQIETEGKHCVVIGRSNIVGKPVGVLMARNSYPGNATVSMCHSKTKNLKELCLSADILIVAIGRPNYLTADMVKPGAVVIDVGITRIPSDKTKSGWKLVGDVDFENVAPKCSYITPVPGGVGLMTIVSLLNNTLDAYLQKHPGV
ncbi:MAG: bifunctional methylenetetrahydrofolate dehydrogenase/methenyltetrahydrofolate cyclohydrolase FolD [Bacteroidales bacterium]|nr:bifunctional methylenetetrahydrofolate dehydrogenase/methenyltetrahydrofolate cyclohydrolase FolD [Bacteroidales bacterium]